MPDKAVPAHTYTLHTQHMVGSTWLGDPQGRPSVPTKSILKLHLASYQVLLTYLLFLRPVRD